MSKIFAFNVAKPTEVPEAPPAGAYDAEQQVWRGQERSVAVSCTFAAFKSCSIGGPLCFTAFDPLPWGNKCD